jgi:hypothetical protein
MRVDVPGAAPAQVAAIAAALLVSGQRAAPPPTGAGTSRWRAAARAQSGDDEPWASARRAARTHR